MYSIVKLVIDIISENEEAKKAKKKNKKFGSKITD